MGDKMRKKFDIRFVLYQVHNIHKLVYENFDKNNFNDTLSLLNYEFKKYQYIRDNLNHNIKVSSYYLEYSTTIDNKLKDISLAIKAIKKKTKNIQITLSKSSLIELYKLHLSNIVLIFNNLSKISNKDKTTIYHIFVYTCKKIKELDSSFSLNKDEQFYLISISPFKAH